MSHGEKHVWLVVEDDPIIRSILRALMTLWDVEPLIFTDGFEAMSWLDQVERGEALPPLPDIALLDIRMPGPLGPEIGQRMRAIPMTSGIPIIIMTAYHMNDADKQHIHEIARPEHLLASRCHPLKSFAS
jgi:CheY-like chemotaxis protein